jgi:hypothetical protein
VKLENLENKGIYMRTITVAVLSDNGSWLAEVEFEGRTTIAKLLNRFIRLPINASKFRFKRDGVEVKATAIFGDDNYLAVAEDKNIPTNLPDSPYVTKLIGAIRAMSNEDVARILKS